MLNFENPNNPNEAIEVTYNGGKWLCGNMNCTRGIEINIYDKDKEGNLKKKPKQSYRALDPKQDKRIGISWFDKHILRRKPLPPPPLLQSQNADK